MSRLFFVYLDITDDAIPFYCGKGTLKRTKNLKRNKKHTNVANKYGQHRLLILETHDESEAKAKEIEIIADCHLNTHRHPENSFACNFTDGGDGNSGFVPTLESRSKMSLNCSAKRQKNREHHSRVMTGKKATLEARQNMSIAQQGRIQTDETRAKISQSQRAKKRKHVSGGRKPGYAHSEETKQKMSETMRKRHAARKLLIKESENQAPS